MAARVEIRGLQQALDAVGDEIQRKAAVRSINEITAKARTATSRKIRERYTVKASKLNEKVKVRKLTFTGGQAKIVATGHSLGPWDYAGTRETKRGLSVKLKVGGPRKVVRSWYTKVYPGGKKAFRRVWRRENARAAWSPKLTPLTAGRLPKRYRLPIETVPTMGAADLYDQQFVTAEVQSLVDREFDAIHRRNYAYYAGTP